MGRHAHHRAIYHRSVCHRIVFAQPVATRLPLCVAAKGVSMHAKDFLRMFAYDHWANRECLAAMKDAGSVSADTVGRMAHILSAQKLWLERIQKQPQSMAVWPTSTMEDW